jgi:hypothetical protein
METESMLHFGGIVLMAIGLIMYLIAYGSVVCVAFQSGALWGLLTLIVPGGSLLFVVSHWKRHSYWFFFGLKALLFLTAGIFVQDVLPNYV